MRSNLSHNPSLSLRAHSGGLGDIVSLNGFTGQIVDEESPDVPIVKFLLTNNFGETEVVFSTIHKKYLKVVKDGKN